MISESEAVRLLCKLHQPDIAMTVEELDAIRERAFADSPAEKPAQVTVEEHRQEREDGDK